MTSEIDDNQYNPSSIIKQAEEKWTNEGNLEAAILVYETTLLEWGDDAMALADNNDAKSYIRDGMASLYLNYANLYRKAKQWKSCEEAYEQATNDALVGSLGRIWLDYARFCEERGRVKAAQNVYRRALSLSSGNGVKDSEEREELWEEFHRMMVESSQKKDLTLEELKQAMKDTSSVIEDVVNLGSVVEEDNGRNGKKRKVGEVGNASDPDGKRIAVDVAQEDVSSVKMDLDGSAKVNPDAASLVSKPGSEAGVKSESVNTTKSSTTVKRLTGAQLELLTASMSKKIEAEATALMSDAASFPPALSAAWVAKDGSNRPSIVSLLFQAKPPSSDMTSGKDGVGPKAALQVVQLLLGGKKEAVDVDPQKDEFDASATVLDLVKCCWAMTAIFELRSKDIMDKLEEKMRRDIERLKGNTENIKIFAKQCETQFQKTIEFLAWESRKILAVQQLLLKRTGVPEMDVTIDENGLAKQRKVCALLHSAVIVREKVGSKAHTALLLNNEGKLKAEVANLPNEQQLPPMQVIPGQPQQSWVPPGSYFQPQQQFFPQQQPQPPMMNMPPPVFPPPPPPPPPPPVLHQQQLQVQGYVPNVQSQQQQHQSFYPMR